MIENETRLSLRFVMPRLLGREQPVSVLLPLLGLTSSAAVGRGPITDADGSARAANTVATGNDDTLPSGSSGAVDVEGTARGIAPLLPLLLAVTIATATFSTASPSGKERRRFPIMICLEG